MYLFNIQVQVCTYKNNLDDLFVRNYQAYILCVYLHQQNKTDEFNQYSNLHSH